VSGSEAIVGPEIRRGSGRALPSPIERSDDESRASGNRLSDKDRPRSRNHD
jgi:hypothetical protein